MTPLLKRALADRANADQEWVAKAAEAGKAEITTLPAAIQPVADAMFDKLLSHSDEIVDLGPQVFALIITHLDTGNVNQARLIYLATVASQEERDDALDQATDGAMKNQQQIDAAWAKAKAITEEILMTAAKTAVPLLITALMAL